MPNNVCYFLSRYGCAVATIALATWVRLLLDPPPGVQFPFATLFLAILLTAWYGGYRPALAAVVLGGLSAEYFLIPPMSSFAVQGWDQQAGLLIFLGTGLGIALLGGSMHHAITTRLKMEQELREANEQLETRVRERTTELVRINESLRDAEERNRFLIEGLQEYAIFMLDPSGNVATWNSGAERTKGYRSEEIIGRHFSCFYPPKDIANGKPARELQQALAEGRCEDVGWRVRKDGSRLWARVVISAMHDNAGRLRGFAKVTRDITEARRADERFRQAVESAPNGMVMINPQGKIVLVNAQTEKLFGYDREELLGQLVEILVPERFRGQHPSYREGFFARPQVRSMGAGRDLFGRRKDGSEFPVEIGLNPIHTEEGPLVLSAIVDITQRKGAEKALHQLNAELEQWLEQLEQTNRELKAKTQENEAFVYSVSHDLRSPLVNLQGFSKELGRAVQELRSHLVEANLPHDTRDRELKILDGPMAKSIRFIQTAVARLSNIIDALLQLSRAGRVIYQRKRVEVMDIVRRIVDSLEVTIKERGATIEINDLPPVLGDPAAVEQIFANLIGNALNYLDARRPGCIEVGCMETTSQLGTYFIRDNGLGISEFGKAKVFQPFQRLHPQSAPGEGMGLAIVQRVIERNDGRIWFESVAGQGSTFFVALPAFHGRETPPTFVQSTPSEKRSPST